MSVADEVILNALLRVAVGVPVLVCVMLPDWVGVPLPRPVPLHDLVLVGVSVALILTLLVLVLVCVGVGETRAVGVETALHTPAHNVINRSIILKGLFYSILLF